MNKNVNASVSRCLMLALGLAFGTGAIAQEDSGIYLGAGFGFTETDTAPITRDIGNALRTAGFSSASVTAEEGATAFKILAGYQVNPNLAFEAYYANLGSYTLSVVTTGPAANVAGKLDLSAMGFDVLGMIPFDRSLSGFAKLGVFGWEAKGTAKGGGLAASTKDDGTDFKFGLGLQFKASRNLLLRAEWEYYNFEYSDFEDVAVGILSVGLLYRF